MTHFADAFYRHKKGRLTAEEARELLGLSGRHFRRLRGRYEEVGLEDLWDLRSRRGPASELEWMRGLDRRSNADPTALEDV